MPTIRQRANGTFELRVVHPSLLRPYYSTHDDRAAADSYGRRVIAALERGEVPPEIQEAAEGRRTPLPQILGAYLKGAPIAASDRPLVEMLRSTVTIDIQAMTMKWVDEWVASMKRRGNLAPGSIRKRVESLARAVDWWNRREHASSVPTNPLRTLPRGYSAYREGEGAPKAGGRRDRRLHDGEEEAIEASILGVRRPDRQRALEVPHRDHFLLLWRLILNTGLRLREAYTLDGANVKIKLKTIHVKRGKTGVARDVPMTEYVYGLVRDSRIAKTSGLLFPFWSGDPNDLRRATNRLSSQFTRVFEYAGITDLTEHDLRHEATCRWMLMRDKEGRWMFRPEEVRRITGHKNVEQFEGYFSLRGSDLADRLWR